MFNTKDLEDKFTREYEVVKKNVVKPNILIIGATGVGKSSIINMIFGEGKAKVSSGVPVTKGINKIQLEEKDVVIYDTEGYELGSGSEQKFEENIVGFIANQQQKDLSQQIHLIWFVISASSNRVLDCQLQLKSKLMKFNIPVAIIFSKTDMVNEDDLSSMMKILGYSSSVNSALQSNESPFFSSTVKDIIEAEPNISIDKVTKWSIKQLPNVLREGFISSQVACLDVKWDEAESIVYQHSSGNALIGFSPIPFSDAPVLITSQTAMLVRIMRVYGFGENAGDLIENVMKGAGANLVVSNLGKSVVGNVLKFIPGVGTVLGGVINASVASAITYALGMAMNKLAFEISEKSLSSDTKGLGDVLDGKEMILKESFNQYFKK